MTAVRRYSRAGIIYRLTDGMRGQTAWIVPDTTLLHPSVLQAACRRKGGIVLPMRAIIDGYFDQYFPAPQSTAASAHVRSLSAHLSTRRSI